MLSGDDEEIGVSYRDEPATMVLAIRGRVEGDQAVSWWMEAFTELHRLLKTAGITRTGPDGAEFPTEFFTEGGAELVAFVPVDRVPSMAGRVEAVARPAARYAVALHEGPMVDMDAAYSAVGRSGPRAGARRGRPDGREVPPVGDEDDLLAHHTEVCWPVMP